MPASVNQYVVLYEGCKLMDGIRQYLLSITAAAIICSILMSILGKKGMYSSVIRMLCGLFMAYTMISPVMKIRLKDFETYLGELSIEANSAVSWGIQSAEEASAEFIKEKTETYILDKASSMGLSIEAEVRLAEEGDRTPYSVLIKGNVSPYAKKQLQTWLKEEFGIPEENQIWI